MLPRNCHFNCFEMAKMPPCVATALAKANSSDASNGFAVTVLSVA